MPKVEASLDGQILLQPNEEPSIVMGSAQDGFVLAGIPIGTAIALAIMRARQAQDGTQEEIPPGTRIGFSMSLTVELPDAPIITTEEYGAWV